MQILLIMLIVVLLAFSVLLLALAKQSPREKQTEDKEQEEYIRDYAETVRQTGGSMKKLEHWKVIAIYLIIYDMIAVNFSYFMALLVRFDFRYSSIPTDYWVAMVASICGTIIYDKNGYILYRQHENNVVGARKKTRKDILVQQIKKIKRKDLRCGRSLLAKQMKILFPKESEKCKAIVWGANSTSFSGKLNLIFNNRYFRKYSNENLCAFIFKVVFELF